MRYTPLACLLFLAACANPNLTKLQQITPSGTPFQNQLATLYGDYARDLNKESIWHWWRAKHYAAKGLDAAQGKTVMPEDVKDHPLPKPIQADMVSAHDQLMAVLLPDVLTAMPKAAASAQVNFDCWLDMQEYDPMNARLTACRDEFFDALHTVHHRVHASNGPSTADQPDFRVFFEWDRSNLTLDGDAIVGKLITSLKGNEKPYKITLGGHTDTSGSAKYNLRLSQLRAETVKDELVAGGINADVVHIYAYGESDPLVPTPDNVREPRNRRVEIFIGK